MSIAFHYTTDGTTDNFLSTAGVATVGINTWYHIAVTVYNGTTNIFVNGVKSASGNYVAPAFVASQPLTMGATSLPSGSGTGVLIDDVRITRDSCRYMMNFVPPTAANVLS